MSATAFIALGSNLGDREDYLQRAVHALEGRPDVRVLQVSSRIETAAVGGPAGQGAYLNAAAKVETELSPRDLLRVLLDVETKLGRVRVEHHGPRAIDLDLLLYGDQICDDPELSVPHPRLHERLFVLQPLAEIAGDVVHPVLQKSIRELLGRIQAGAESAAKKAGAGRELQGIRAAVTGSSAGIGKAIALELARAGADMIVHCRRAMVGAEEVAAGVRLAGGKSRVLQADLAKEDDCRRLADEAWRDGDGIDIWINNAGADTLTGEAGRWSFERKLAEVLAVDVTATVLLARDVGARMKKRGHGVILNMGWDQADTGMEGDSGQLFAASKAAVMAFSKSLALTLAPEVRVNCLAPGWIRTAWGESASPVWQERVLRETPLKRWGTPEDVAGTARWLVSPAAAYITGQVIRVNGGAVR